MNKIGQYTYCPTQLIVHYEEEANLTIGKFCSIGDNCQVFLGGNHRFDWLTTHPVNALFDATERPITSTKGDVNIGNDVWIGKDVTIMSGVNIGDGAIIGACSVIGHNVYPYEIVAGNPIQHIRMRFDRKTIDILQKINWWDWPIEWIKEARNILQSNNIAELENFWTIKQNG